MLSQFLAKQFIDVIQWNEPEDGVLSYRYPMQDMEIMNGGQLTVRESQMAAFINEGRIADVFGPGLYTLTTRNLPLLTDLMNWDKAFESPFKSDVYFFSTRQQIDQKWGTATPITLRDKEFGAVRLRAFGNYAYRVADPRVFFNQVAGTRDAYFAADLEGQLRTAIVAGMTDTFANSDVSFLDMAANQAALAAKIADELKPTFAGLGLELSQFVVENVSLPDELQKDIDSRIGISMVGDLGKYTQLQAAESLRRGRCQHRRNGRHGRRPRRWSGDGAGSHGSDFAGRCSAAIGRGCAGSCSRTRCSTRPCRRHQVLHRVWQAHRGARQILFRVREAPMNCPSCGAPMRIGQGMAASPATTARASTSRAPTTRASASSTSCPTAFAPSAQFLCGTRPCRARTCGRASAAAA
jgi:membrane protease subunit (stomatin/prohibitin family)